MEPSRWLADAMVGRLARYLRFVGLDTEYARGLSDDEILEQLRTERRVLVTRDRALAQRSPGSVLLSSPRLADQWRELRRARPDLPTEVRFDRCTECNGVLRSVDLARSTWPEQVPRERVARGLPVYECATCGHLYWEGSHTARIRAQFAAWANEESR